MDPDQNQNSQNQDDASDTSVNQTPELGSTPVPETPASSSPAAPSSDESPAPEAVPAADTAPPTTPAWSPSPQPETPPTAPAPGTGAAPVPQASGPFVPPAGAATTPGVLPPVQPAQGAGAPGGSSVVGDFGPAPVSGAAPAVFGQPPKRRKKLLLTVIIVVVVLLAGAAAYYFGYYTNPSVIYSQSLSDTATAYTRLVNYANDQEKANYKGLTGSGSYKLTSGSTTTDGNLSFKTDGSNSDTTFDVGLGVTRLNVELRTIKQSGASDPDIYLKASGLDGVGDLLGSPELGTALDQLNGQWIAVDHTLLENLQSSVSQSSGSLTPPTEADVMDELQAFGNVNKQYVFTTKKDKAVLTLVKKVGRETVDGHKTYHYKVAFNKANVKAYITAQRNALESSKLGAWLKQNNYESAITSAYNSLEQSANSIKSSDTFDLWSDINTRVVYKVRFPGTTNPAENYTDFGLNYKGGDTFPIFLSGQSQDGSGTSSGNLTATINSDTNTVALNVDLKSTGSSPFELSGNFTFKPSNAAVNISAPQNPVQLSQVLDELGLGQLLDGLSSGSSLQPSSSDTSGVSGVSL